MLGLVAVPVVFEPRDVLRPVGGTLDAFVRFFFDPVTDDTPRTDEGLRMDSSRSAGAEGGALQLSKKEKKNGHGNAAEDGIFTGVAVWS